MACKFNPELLRNNYDQTGNALIERSAHLKFRDDLIRILRQLRIRTITDIYTIAGLAIGLSTGISVSHVELCEFCFAEYPYFEPVEGIEVQVMAMINLGGVAYATSGSMWWQG